MRHASAAVGIVSSRYPRASFCATDAISARPALPACSGYSGAELLEGGKLASSVWEDVVLVIKPNAVSLHVTPEAYTALLPFWSTW